VDGAKRDANSRARAGQGVIRCRVPVATSAPSTIRGGGCEGHQRVALVEVEGVKDGALPHLRRQRPQRNATMKVEGVKGGGGRLTWRLTPRSPTRTLPPRDWGAELMSDTERRKDSAGETLGNWKL